MKLTDLYTQALSTQSVQEGTVLLISFLCASLFCLYGKEIKWAFYVKMLHLSRELNQHYIRQRSCCHESGKPACSVHNNIALCCLFLFKLYGPRRVTRESSLQLYSLIFVWKELHNIRIYMVRSIWSNCNIGSSLRTIFFRITDPDWSTT